MNLISDHTPLFYRCELPFTLTAPHAVEENESEESACFFLRFPPVRGSEMGESEFFAEFSLRIQSIKSILHRCDDLNPSDSLSEWAHVKMLSWQISSCVEAFNSYRQRKPITLRIAQTVYAMAQDLKRHDSLRKTVWNDLPTEHRSLLHRLSPWTEDLHILSTPLYFQWLGDGHLERARQSGETLTDFGQGRLFKVLPPTQRGNATVFPLSNDPGYHLLKTSSARTLDYPSYYLNIRGMGRINELFDVRALADASAQGGEDSRIFNHQLMTLYTCYRAALGSLFDLSIAIPKAMGKQGEWSIWPNARQVVPEGSPLSEDQLTILHRFFHMEKLWRINFLSDDQGQIEAKWALSEEVLVEEGVLPLPAFITKDVNDRHRKMLKRFKLDASSQERWSCLEAQTEAENHQLTKELEWLQKLQNAHLITIEDLLHPSAQLLHMIRLFKQNQLPHPSAFPYEMLEEVEHCREHLSPEENFYGRLLCIRKAAFLAKADLEDVNRHLLSLLHDEMMLRSSQAFLREFQQAMTRSRHQNE